MIAVLKCQVHQIQTKAHNFWLGSLNSACGCVDMCTVHADALVYLLKFTTFKTTILFLLTFGFKRNKFRVLYYGSKNNTYVIFFTFWTLLFSYHETCENHCKAQNMKLSSIVKVFIAWACNRNVTAVTCTIMVSDNKQRINSHLWSLLFCTSGIIFNMF